MWTVVKEGHVILITAHIDDFIIECAEDGFLMNSERRSFKALKALMRVRCTRIWDVKFSVSSKQAKLFYFKNIMPKVLRTYDYWDCIPALTPMVCPDLAWSYSELSKYVQNPGKAHMDDAHHVLRYLRATYGQGIVYERTNEMANTIWGWTG